MYRIALVNMPCAATQLPSLALTQLKTVLEMQLGDRVAPEIFYFNLDFARYLVREVYEVMSNSVPANTAGLGDWYFRDVAFPGLPDNAEAYLLRHFSADKKTLEMLELSVFEKRPGLDHLFDQLIDRHGLDQYPLVGFTSMFAQTVASLALARKLKARNPAIITLMGGANCESPMGQVIARNAPDLDFVFAGAGLKNFPEFVERAIAGDVAGAEQIPGVLTRKALALQPGRHASGPELDVDVEVPVDFDDYFAALDERRLAGTVESNVIFETSRGCWWGERSHCTFCGLNGSTMRYRAMSAEKALRQFERLFEKYGSRVSGFHAVDNILPRSYFSEVLPEVQVPEKAYVFYEIKADIKEHEAELLAKAKFKRLQPGIEALASSTLKLMGKGTTSFQNLKFLKYCVAYGITPIWNILVGFPGEPKEVYEKYLEDLPMLTHFCPPAGVFPVRFDRFSPYHTRAADYGLKLRPNDFYRMVYPWDERDLMDLAYFFVDENYDAGYMVNTSHLISQLRDVVAQWKTRFFQSDRGRKPELVFRPGGASRVVYDSRSGQAIEHELEAPELQLLDALASQMKVARLASVLGLEAAEVEGWLARLSEKQLIFRDGDLFMSLVVEQASAERGVEAPLEDAAPADFPIMESRV